MYFKKLEIIGFKSFYSKTTLDFEPGVTAIVGPNGCGKSNIFDSIRWVLGEQSVKALRGSEMQDVIFNGTESKEPLGMAEVTLVFDNDKQYFAVDHHEVAITRRIFRSGESEYLLNKTQVRLKDILDLLMGTGIGAESYSLIQQGKIDLVLSSRPEDRRLVFDEASGISKYKAQKKETMRRLEETEQNLLRVNDIITEVKRQISSLERQANKARRYKEAFEELKSKEINLGIWEKKALLEQKTGLLKDLSELETREEQLLNAIKEQEAGISSHQVELRALDESILNTKNEIMGLANLESRDKEHITFNQERILEFTANKKHLEAQIEQTKKRLQLDEDKLNKVKAEYEGIEKAIENKTAFLTAKENELTRLTGSIKASLETITKAKRGILDNAARIANTKNEIADAASQNQIYAARKNRLGLEKAKIHEERAGIEISLDTITQELAKIEKEFSGLNLDIAGRKNEAEQERLSIEEIKSAIEDLERQKLTLESQKEFLEKLRMKYEDIGESMNAVIYLDKLPSAQMSGLVVKINGAASPETQTTDEPRFKVSGEAKPIDLDTQRINEAIAGIAQKIIALQNDKAQKETRSQDITAAVLKLQDDLRTQEINLANKKNHQENTLGQLNKIKEEEEIILLELIDVEKEMDALEVKLHVSRDALLQLDNTQKQLEDGMNAEQNSIASNNNLKEEALVAIAQTKTELDSLKRRVGSDAATLKILEDTYRQDKDTMIELERQVNEAGEKQQSMESEIAELEKEIQESRMATEKHNAYLRDAQSKYSGISNSISEVVKRIESDRAGLDTLKNRLYELQMQSKDVDFKYLSIKERILQGYKIDLDTLTDITEEFDRDTLAQDIQRLKEKLESYGTVNLVAIEEYDELKKRYDFLSQQENDLATAKASLHEAIQKINRTTKKMFLDTFEKVKEEFRNYFRLLFNGGDCQIFLIDEQDPLESGIEIICRPPGKKLQNILLLSGGEKSLAAIALIFAIFKVKPAPFCVLDEIDAALDEANVDRFGRLLQEFTKTSQFIVITHNKKTIANADVMYGITMEESGISKIVSVKFAQQKPADTKNPAVNNQPVAEAV